MANQFSAHLDDLFSIDKGLDTTLRQVENKLVFETLISLYTANSSADDSLSMSNSASSRIFKNGFVKLKPALARTRQIRPTMKQKPPQCPEDEARVQHVCPPCSL